MILSQWRFSIPAQPLASEDSSVRGFQRSPLLNDYVIHKSLWKAFPAPSGSVRSFLFRSEKKDEFVDVLVLSSGEPQRGNDGELIRKIAFRPALEEGECYSFSLRANPVKRLKEARCRVPLVSEKTLIEWLERKLDGSARLKGVELLGKNDLHFTKRDAGQKLTVDIATVDYQGVIECLDAQRLLGLVQSGVGPAKAFGCGFLLLQKRP